MPVRLFVGNLSYDATEAELREHFGTIGPVTYCYLPTDRESGRPRGFALAQAGARDRVGQGGVAAAGEPATRRRSAALRRRRWRRSASVRRQHGSASVVW